MFVLIDLMKIMPSVGSQKQQKPCTAGFPAALTYNLSGLNWQEEDEVSCCTDRLSTPTMNETESILILVGHWQILHRDGDPPVSHDTIEKKDSDSENKVDFHQDSDCDPLTCMTSSTNHLLEAPKKLFGIS